MMFLALLTRAKHVLVSLPPSPPFSQFRSPRVPTLMYTCTGSLNSHNNPPEVDAKSSILKVKELRLREVV